MGVRGPWPQPPLEAESVRPVATLEPPAVMRRTHFTNSNHLLSEVVFCCFAFLVL